MCASRAHYKIKFHVETVARCCTNALFYLRSKRTPSWKSWSWKPRCVPVMLWANENSTTGMPTEPWKRSFRTVDFAVILENEVTFHVGETIIYPYLYIYINIYPKKWQEPVLVNLMCLSVLRLFQMLRMFITPLVMEPSWSQQSAIWTSFCLDVLAHFFTWIEWSILGCDVFFPLRFSETDPTTSNTYICLTLACSLISWKQVQAAQ